MRPLSGSIDAIRDLIGRHCPVPRQATSVPGLTLFRCLAPTAPARSLYEPRLCIVIQGRKTVMLGSRVHHVDASQCLIATVDLPVTAAVADASAEEPHLALTLSLDRVRIADLLLQGPSRPLASRDPVGLAVDRHGEDLLAPVARLLALLERPADIPILAPMIEREVLYRVLQGTLGGLLASYAQAGTHLAQVGQATAWIKDHYAEPLSVAALAARVGMGVTSLHRHFKTVTTLSPLQYRREVRLGEARRRLLVEGGNAGAIGFAVGYDSQSQFSREYRRMFGNPPAADALRLRGAGGA